MKLRFESPDGRTRSTLENKRDLQNRCTGIDIMMQERSQQIYQNHYSTIANYPTGCITATSYKVECLKLTSHAKCVQELRPKQITIRSKREDVS